jgi:hypothetical protein
MTVTLSTTDVLTGEIQIKQTKLIPDAFLFLRFDDGMHHRTFPILLELDRGTEAQRVWREKIRAYLAAIEGPYQATFGQESLTVAVVTPAGEQRVAQLLGWLEAELTGQHRHDIADIVLVTGVDPAEVDPWEFFLLPLWRAPWGRELLPLLEVPTAA